MVLKSSGDSSDRRVTGINADSSSEGDVDLSVDVTARLTADVDVASRAGASTSAFRAPVTERLGPFEVIETVSDSTASTVARARRINGSRRGEVVRLVVDRRPRDPAALELLRGIDVPGIARFLG